MCKFCIDPIADIESNSPMPSISSVKVLFTLALHEKRKLNLEVFLQLFYVEKY